MKYDPANSDFFIEISVHENEQPEAPQGAGYWWKQARARNEFVQHYLKPHHDLVLWIDADIVDYPTSLPRQLYGVNPLGITAPLVLIDKTWTFYDLFGFIKNGQRSSQSAPYFAGMNVPLPKFVELESVGSIYMSPAWLHRSTPFESEVTNGDLHPSLAGYGYTDHWPIMRLAREVGLIVGCLTTAVAFHADLPSYGESWH